MSASDALERTLMALHPALDERFFRHQQALLDRDLPRAISALSTYRDPLLLHMADEETLVQPLYAAHGGDQTDAPVKLFLGEHARMRDFLADFDVRLERLVRQPDDRTLLELFDRQATYKNLCLHHDLRERNAMYPLLSARVPAAAQLRVLAQLRLRALS
jgi:hemerythrin-like domain-containing protein